MRPSISIIIPTFNRREPIQRVIQSVLDQGFEAWELIIVDDGSTDGTKEALQTHLKDPRVKYVDKKNSGVSDTRNVGAYHAMGDFLFFLDSDDLLMQHTLSKLKECIDQQQPDIIFMSCRMIKDGQEKIKKPADLGKAFRNVRGLFLAGSFCIRKETFIHAGGFDKSLIFGENFELGLRVCQYPLRTSVIDHISISYFIDSTKRVSNQIMNKLNSNLFILNNHQALLQRDKTFLSTTLSQTGYFYQASGNRSAAFTYYKKSFMANPLNYRNLYRFLSSIFSA